MAFMFSVNCKERREDVIWSTVEVGKVGSCYRH